MDDAAGCGTCARRQAAAEHPCQALDLTIEQARYDNTRRRAIAAIVRHAVGDPDGTGWYPQIIGDLVTGAEERSAQWMLNRGYSKALN